MEISEPEAAEMFARADQICEDLGGDTRDLDEAFLGLSDETQRACFRVLATPDRRLKLIDALSDEAFEDLMHFVDNMTPEEEVAVARALGL